VKYFGSWKSVRGKQEERLLMKEVFMYLALYHRFWCLPQVLVFTTGFGVSPQVLECEVRKRKNLRQEEGPETSHSARLGTVLNEGIPAHF
jgi:hypothetical protein